MPMARSQSFTVVSSCRTRRCGRRGKRQPSGPRSYARRRCGSPRPCKVPKLQGGVIAAREGGAAIGRKGNRPDPVRMPGEGLDLLARGKVPELQGCVEAAGQGGAAIGGKGNGIDRVRMPGEDPDLLARGEVPKLHGCVAAAGQGGAAIGGKGNRPDPVRMPGEGADLLARAQGSKASTWSRSLPERAVRPSGEKATDRTQSACPEKVWISLPVARSQSFNDLSKQPDNAVRPSGEKATELTPSAWPTKVWIS